MATTQVLTTAVHMPSMLGGQWLCLRAMCPSWNISIVIVCNRSFDLLHHIYKQDRQNLFLVVKFLIYRVLTADTSDQHEFMPFSSFWRR